MPFLATEKGNNCRNVARLTDAKRSALFKHHLKLLGQDRNIFVCAYVGCFAIEIFKRPSEQSNLHRAAIS